jgi:CRISPR-associated protein Csx14
MRSSSSPSFVEPATAIITMGGQAQVVTFALDALYTLDAAIETVLILHFSLQKPRIKRALAQLSAEFAGNEYQGKPLDYRRVSVQVDDQPLPHVRTAKEAEAVWRLARDLLTNLKQAGRRLHLCIAGGPRILALTLTSAAMLHCDHRDRLWHLYTPKAFIAEAQDGAILHAPPDAGVRLIPVPIAPWGSYFPALRQLAQPTATQMPLSPTDMSRCDAVWTRLTDRQRDVLLSLAKGHLPQEAADALGITLNTLDTHKTQILAECRLAWKLPEDERLTYHFLHDRFGPWLTLRHPSR